MVAVLLLVTCINGGERQGLVKALQADCKELVDGMVEAYLEDR